MSVLTTHEEEIYGGYIHSLNIHPSFRMADGAEAITLGGENIFGNCQDCQKSSRLMCWSHVHWAFTPKLKPVEAANKEVAKALLNDLEDIQWTAINETFFDQIELVEKKYLKNNLLDVNTVSALFRDFFKYFKDISIWVHSGENKWYEGSAPHRSNNNQGIEAVNKAIKQSYLSVNSLMSVSEWTRNGAVVKTRTPDSWDCSKSVVQTFSWCISGSEWSRSRRSSIRSRLCSSCPYLSFSFLHVSFTCYILHVSLPSCYILPGSSIVTPALTLTH